MYPAHIPNDHDDADLNNSGNETFQEVLDARLSRRSMLRGSVGTAATAVLGAWGVSACGGSDDAPAPAPAPSAPPPAPAEDGMLTTLGFTAVDKTLADSVTVPVGYTATPIYALGDPLTSMTPDYRNDGTDDDFEYRAGDHHDGMEYFGLSANGTSPDPKGSERGLLAINHEATSNKDVRSYYLHPTGGTPNPRPPAEADKEVNVHGLSVVEVKKTAGAWGYVRNSDYNRRVTPLTPVDINGPVRGNALVITKYSTNGNATRGTLNNCGTGYTPWGTYLTGEENWAGYFTRVAGDDAARADKSAVSLVRYGRAQGAASRHGWETAGADDKYARWNISKTGASVDGSDDYRNELNGFGYIVEMDPFDKNAKLRKRTALGRFAHESAAFKTPVANKPLAVYMGDDSIGEYIYKFVSTKTWNPADATPANRITTGDTYLDDGKLYAAKFNADGKGQWIELDIGNTLIANYATYDFADQADVLVNARLAADAVGATKMDRPEWCAVHPVTGDIYYTLTKNANRSAATADPANPRSYTDQRNGVNQSGNVHGHIIRMAESGNDGSAATFDWDIYLFGAESTEANASINVSALTADQDFSSPDGLWFSKNTGLCWIQTDDSSFTDVTNCMMLVGVPGEVGDGARTTITNGVTPVDTYVGKKPTASTLKRFLVGPKDCELTGCTETPDGKTLFANIQHPGEVLAATADVNDPTKYVSRWPGNAGYQAAVNNTTSRPRSATIAITKDDGGRIGT